MNIETALNIVLAVVLLAIYFKNVWLLEQESKRIRTLTNALLLIASKSDDRDVVMAANNAIQGISDE